MYGLWQFGVVPNYLMILKNEGNQALHPIAAR
jgi:hypothetical protein